MQHKSIDAGTTTSSSLTFTSNNTTGNWIGVCIQAGAQGETFTVSDSKGNTYHKAIQFNETTNGNTLGIFYAENIAGGANTVTVSDTTSSALRFAILEYSGIALSGSLDQTEAAQGTSSSPNSGTETPTANGELLLGAILSAGTATFTAGSGYTIEESIPAAPNTKLIGEDQVQTTAGAASASATLSVSTQWAAGLASFSPAPTIASLSPTSGTAGTPVTISGNGFGSTQGSSTVTFNGIAVTPTSWSSASIVVPVPTGATTGNVVVTLNGAPSNGVSFTVLSGGIALVQHTSIDVANSTSSSLAFASNNTAGNFIAVLVRAGRSGEVFTVTDSKGNSYRQAVQFAVTLDTPNGHALAIYYAENIAAGANTVTVSDTISASLRFAIFEYSGVATTSSIDVTASAQGSNVSPNSGNATTSTNGELILGAISTADSAAFTAGSGWSTKEFVPAEPNTKLTAEDQIQATGGSISASASLGASDPWGAVLATFKVAGGGGSAPSITSLSPTSGGVGTSVTITGTNFGSSQGSSTVTFNGTTATPSSWNSTSIVVPVPSGATTGNVVVTAGGVASNGVNFTVIPPPTITSFTPTSAPVGTLISVTGTNFNANSATPTVALSQQGGGTIPAPVSSFSATNVSFVIPTGAATGNITVTANGMNAVSSTSLTITAASSFTVSATPGTATLLPGQSTTFEVSLASTNGFTQLASLGVSGVPSGVTVAFQPTQITAGQFSILTLTAPSGQAPGASSLTISGTATVQGIAQSSSASVTLQVQGTSGVAFAGRVAVTDSYDTPLVGLTVKMLGVNQTGVSTGCTGSTTTDGSGNFVLNGLSASCAGGQLVQYDPSTVSSPTGTYSGVTLSYQLTSGQVTTPGGSAAPAFIVHLPRVDNAETFSVQQNASVDQTFSSTSIPGVAITVYAGTTLTKADGTTPNPFPLSVVEIPYDRLPELMPPNPTQDPVFAMSIEPFNSSSCLPNSTSCQPVAVSFPNRSKLPPGTNMPLTSLNPTMGIMQNYGTGTVSPDGTQVVPDFDSTHPGHRYGISHFDWHFQTPGPNANNPPPCDKCPKGGDPVDLASGLMVIRKTDIAIGGARGQVGITRVYRGATTNQGPFGIGTSHNYFYLLDTSNYSSGLINLILPDGNQIPFVQSGAAWGNSTIPSTQGVVLSNLSCAFGAGCSATIRWKNGTTFQFQPHPSRFTFSFLTAITDSNGNKTTLVHSSAIPIEIIQIIDPVGRALNLTYDGSQRITSITDPIGRTVGYTYTTQGYLQTVTDANSPAGVTTYGYDANNNLQTIKDARGIIYLTNNTFDPFGRVLKQTTIDGAVTTFNYTVLNPAITATSGPSGGFGGGTTVNGSPVNQTTVTDPLGNQTTYHFNPAGFLLDVTDALGRKTVYTRQSGTNLLMSVTDPLGRTTAFTYDSAGNMTKVTRLAGTSNAVPTSFTYDPTFNKITSVTDPLGVGHTTSFSYDKAGNLVKTQDPVDPAWTLGYDGAGELTSVTDPLSNPSTQIVYDGFGNVTQAVDPLGRKLSRISDAVGRAQSLTNAFGQTAQYQYTPLNQVTQITDPLNGQTSLTYDPNGNLLTLVDALGSTHTTTYTYDNMDRVLTRTDPLGHMECYGTVSGSACQTGTGYDLNGNLIQFTDRRGKVATFQYDAVNRRTSASFGPGDSVTYTYDAADRLVQVTDSVSGTITRAYDNLDRLISESTPQGSVSYAYDAAGRRTSMTVSGQPTSITYGYDNANRLTQIQQGSATVSIVPDADGRRQSVTLPNGVKMAYGYDAASQLQSITYTQGSTQLGNLTYAYDLAGRRTGVGGSYARTGVPQAVPAGTPPNGNNQLAQWNGKTLTYDLNGNVLNDGTNTYTWNARNQLVTISGGVSASFQYDAFGRRVSKTIGGTTQFLYDGVNPVQELSGTTAPANLLTGGVDEYFQRTDSAGARSFLTDALGSTVGLADSTGTVQTSYTFEPFGNTSVTGSTTTNSFAFTGRELDPTGLYFYRARYYNPQLQRFISEDPLGFAGGGLNFYAYVFDSPTNLVDPFGLYSGWDFLQDVGSFSEGAADALTLGLVSRFNNFTGANVAVNRCGWVHGAGTITGIALSTAIGAVGLPSKLAGYGIKAKQAIGETLSVYENTLRGSTLVGEQVAAVEEGLDLTTRFDSVWNSSSGVRYYVESKFGTSALRDAQLLAQEALGDAYNVERWGYDFFARIGGYAGAGWGGAGAMLGRKSDCH